MPKNTAAALDRAVYLLDRVIGGGAIVAVAVMVVLVIAEVFTRFVIGSSIFFVNELSRLMFVWVIFLGLPLALSRGRHVGIMALDQMLPPFYARLVFRFTCALVGALMLVVMVRTFGLMIDNWDQRLNVLPISKSLFYVPIPIGTFVSVIYLTIMLVTADRVLVRETDPTDE